MARRKLEVVIGILEEAIKRDPDPGWADPLRKRLDDVRKESLRIDPDLVGHWKFDEGGGATVLDSSGHGAVGEIKGATWVEGRIGKALRFNGENSYVEFPRTPDLDTLQENNFTIAAWFKPEVDPPIKDGSGGFAIVAKEGRHEGLLLKTRFEMAHWLFDGTASIASFVRPVLPPGRFYHLAGVLDRTQGLIRIVVDGKELGTRKFTPGSGPWDFKKVPWRVGMGYINPAHRYAFPANGIIDDVRLYRRALNDEEIQQLIPK